MADTETDTEMEKEGWKNSFMCRMFNKQGYRHTN